MYKCECDWVRGRRLRRQMCAIIVSATKAGKDRAMCCLSLFQDQKHIFNTKKSLAFLSDRGTDVSPHVDTEIHS